MKEKTKNLPIVAIIGRPNVGKSSLFNLLSKREKAIVSPVPGVTRDRNTHTVELDKKSSFLLIDTGGYTMEKDDDFRSYIQNQGAKAIEASDLLLFMVEYEDIKPDDFSLAEVIKKSGKECLLLVNKVDNEKRENYIYQHYELNLGDPLGISVIQKTNIDKLKKEIKKRLPEFYAEEKDESKPEEEIINVSIVGKPNVGKSSLLNKILGEERSIVSDVPGTTRDSIEEAIVFNGKKMLFVDTAGIRRKSKVHENIEFYSVRKAIASVEHSDVIVLMIDAIENISEQDKKIAGIALQRYKALIIVVNKWDLVEEEYKGFATYEDFIRFKFSVTSFVPVINISVIKDKNIKKLLDLIVKVNKQYNKRLDTGEFNRFLKDITEAYPPKIKRGKFKIYYGTQVEVSPVKFVLFCNNPKNCPGQYKSYIINRIREKYGFDGIPIDIKLKGRESEKK
jgi:GTP-binding protein